MRPKEKRKTGEQPVIGWQLDLALNPNHELFRLAAVIPWDRLATDFGTLYCADNGRPGVPIRLMVGLHLLKHIDGISDEAVVAKWVENPYWQWFCGEEFFQHELPINPSQMTRWRKRIGEEGMEKLLQATIETGKITRTITERSFEKVIVDTTVQPKAIQHPTDARLYRKVHAAMLRIAEKEGLDLRQSYRRLMDRAFRKHGGHIKAKQFKRAKKVLKSLKTMTGRVVRDVERKLSDAAWETHRGKFLLSELILTQKRTTKGKVYSLHASEVECIAKRHLRRRSAVEPEIGHMKAEGLLGRNFLKGTEGDAINAILCGAGHNLRKILARLRALLYLLTGEARRALVGILARLASIDFSAPHPKAA